MHSVRAPGARTGRHVVKIRKLLRRAQPLWGALLVAMLAPANAAEPAALDASEPGASELGASEGSLLAYAEAHSPELAAMSFERDAAEARAASAGRFDDPMFELELQDIDSDSFSLSPSAAGSTRYLVSQSLPFWGKRGLRREVARSEALRASKLRDDAALTLRLRIGERYAQLWYATRTLETLDELSQTLQALEALAQARYASGLVPQQDAIKVAVERTELARRRLDLEGLQARSAASVNALLARPVDAALATPRAPPPVRRVDDLATLQTRLRDVHPALAAQHASEQSAALTERLVRRNRYPDFVLGVAPIQMDRSLEAWDVMLGFNLPLQRGRRRAEEREAQLMHRAAEARTAALTTELTGMLGEAWAQWRSAQRQTGLLRDTLLPLAEASYRSALESYQVAAVDFTTLLEALRQRTASRLDLLEAELEMRMRALEIERLAGATP
jgi:outer membrane protein TolC